METAWEFSIIMIIVMEMVTFKIVIKIIKDLSMVVNINFIMNIDNFRIIIKDLLKIIINFIHYTAKIIINIAL